MRPWPDPAALPITLPDGVQIRRFHDHELDALPAYILRWYPVVRVGAESVFTDPAWLRAHVATVERPDRDLLLVHIAQDGALVGMLSFERQDASQTLHARLGALDPERRTGAIGYLGFMLFEALAEALGAELLMVWVTLESRGQQYFAARRGFRLCGVVPGFDRDARPDGSDRRVAEALYTKLRVAPEEVEAPAAEALEPATQALLALIESQVGPRRR